MFEAESELAHDESLYRPYLGLLQVSDCATGIVCELLQTVCVCVCVCVCADQFEQTGRSL